MNESREFCCPSCESTRLDRARSYNMSGEVFEELRKTMTGVMWLCLSCHQVFTYEDFLKKGESNAAKTR